MNNKVEKKHNGEVSLLKFLFSLLILAFHLGSYFGNFKYGYIGVEFFFIVSGFYFCKNIINKKVIDKEISISSFEFLKNKFFKFLPYYFILYILAIPISIYIDNFSKNDFILALMNLFTIPNYENRLYVTYGITWYINSMLIIEFILYPLLLKFKDKIIYIFSPIVIFFSFCILIINFNWIGDSWSLLPFSFEGIIRALMDINIGIFLYGIIDKLKDVKLTDFSRFLITTFEIIGYVLVVYLSNKHTVSVEFVLLLIVILSLFITLSEKDYLFEICNNKFFYYLEKLSLPIYIFQFIFIELIMYFNNKFTWNLNFLKSFFILIALSVIWAVIILKIFDFFSKHKDSIKKAFIK